MFTKVKTGVSMCTVRTKETSKSVSPVSLDKVIRKEVGFVGIMESRKEYLGIKIQEKVRPVRDETGTIVLNLCYEIGILPSRHVKYGEITHGNNPGRNTTQGPETSFRSATGTGGRSVLHYS